MFAPHCPTCAARVLLGPSRIVTAEISGIGPFEVKLRCFCGTVVDHDAVASGQGDATTPPERLAG